MFENAEPAIDRILELVNKCPEPLQNKCFEILLTAYVESIKPRAPAADPGGGKHDDDKGKNNDQNRQPLDIPEAVRPRFATTAARLKVTLPSLAAMFDFHNDPFTFHALDVPGSTAAKKMRNVALLLGVKNYLITGKWIADMKEFRAMCVDQKCYDRGNMHKNLNSAEDYFKDIDDQTIPLSGAGQTAAEKLLASIAQPKEDNASDQ
jgi:hypothetical protein